MVKAGLYQCCWKWGNTGTLEMRFKIVGSHGQKDQNDQGQLQQVYIGMLQGDSSKRYRAKDNI